jgi:hypothetical protein
MKKMRRASDISPINDDFFWTGHPRQVYSSVCRSLSALTRESRVVRFKIGITNHPRRRFTAYVDAYDEMIVLYRSGSIQNVSDMEAMLVEHNRGWSKNRTGGGGGNIGQIGPYYLYVVLAYYEARPPASDAGALAGLLLRTALLSSGSTPSESEPNPSP